MINVDLGKDGQYAIKGIDKQYQYVYLCGLAGG